MNRISALLIMFFTVILTALPVYAQRPGSDSENQILSAVQKYNEHDFNAARSILKVVLQKDADTDAAWYYLALISLAERDLDNAEFCLKQALAVDPQNFWYRYKLAGLYAITSRGELTIDIYETLLKDFPKKSDLYYDLAELYSAQKEYDKALATLDEIEKVFGMTESLAVYRFNLLRMTGRVEEAYASLEEYNKKYSSPYILSTLADNHISMYNDSTALAYYNEALDIAPDFSPALLGKAEVFRMTRRYEEYFDILNVFVSSPESSTEGKCEYMMAVVERTEPRFVRTFIDQLDSTMTRLLTLHPTDSLVLRTVGAYYYSTGRDDKAKTAFEANVNLYPESFSASANLVEFLMYAQMWEDLSREGRKAFERFPKEAAFLEMAGVGDYNLNDFEKVLQSCEKILQVAPKDTSKTLRAWSTIGDIYHEFGDVKKAYKAYDKALKINPDNVYVLNNYAYYLSLEGKSLKKAHNMSLKTIEAEPDNATYLDTFGWILFLEGKPAEAKQIFKRAMLCGGKDSAVILDHYADVLYALKEYDMAFVYWSLAKQKNTGDLPGLDAKIQQRKAEVGR